MERPLKEARETKGGNCLKGSLRRERRSQEEAKGANAQVEAGEDGTRERPTREGRPTGGFRLLKKQTRQAGELHDRAGEKEGEGCARTVGRRLQAYERL